MGAPPATGARRSRSALHSARDVKPGGAPDTGPRGPARDADAAGTRCDQRSFRRNCPQASRPS
jgi:hypothetical protein